MAKHKDHLKKIKKETEKIHRAIDRLNKKKKEDEDSKVTCPHCHKKTRKGSEFCTNCGEKIKAKSHSGGFKASYVVISVLIIACILLVFLLNNEVSSKRQLSSYNQELEQEIEGLNEQILVKNNQIEELGGQISSTQQQVSSIQSELSQTESQLSQQTTEAETVKNELQDILHNLNYLESWVSDNAELVSHTYSTVTSMCGHSVTVSNGICTIDTKELGQNMKQCLGYTWVDDKTTSNFNQGDVIYDAQTFFNSKVGDCDDFSLFYTAWLRSEYNYAKYYCSESNIYVKFSDGKTLKCPCDFYAICGGLNSGGGHCETAITPGSADPYSPSSFLNSVYIVEPQSGYYSGTTYEEFSSIWQYFTEDDFIGINSGTTVSSSIQQAKSKAEALLS